VPLRIPSHGVCIFFLLCLAGGVCEQTPAGADAFPFAVIGDTGTGGQAQYQIAALLTEQQKKLHFQSVLMLGDNLYGRKRPKDYGTKFEQPYAQLLKNGVNFYAVLGNHDRPDERFYKPFHMEGRRYYSVSPQPNVRFFALDSTHLDKEQVDWLEKELARSVEAWKIAFLHHPLYSSGARHGSNLSVRRAVEPLFVKYGVAVVLAGHDHFYERIKPQKGISYFVDGGAAKLRAGNARKSEMMAVAFDRDNSFLLMEIAGDTLNFRAISRTGETVDAGSILRPQGQPQPVAPPERIVLSSDVCLSLPGTSSLVK
jgi:predicted phosphodiesterase